MIAAGLPPTPPPRPVPAPPIMAPPAPIGVGAVPAPIARLPITGPRTANEYGLFQRAGGAFGEPQLARRRDWHGCGVIRWRRKGDTGRDCGGRKDRITHFFPPYPSGQIDACIRIRTYPNARVARIDAIPRRSGNVLFALAPPFIPCSVGSTAVALLNHE